MTFFLSFSYLSAILSTVSPCSRNECVLQIFDKLNECFFQPVFAAAAHRLLRLRLHPLPHHLSLHRPPAPWCVFHVVLPVQNHARAVLIAFIAPYSDLVTLHAAYQPHQLLDQCMVHALQYHLSWRHVIHRVFPRCHHRCPG